MHFDSKTVFKWIVMSREESERQLNQWIVMPTEESARQLNQIVTNFLSSRHTMHGFIIRRLTVRLNTKGKSSSSPFIF